MARAVSSGPGWEGGKEGKHCGTEEKTTAGGRVNVLCHVHCPSPSSPLPTTIQAL